jgi:acetyl-CoA carboxylase beta subunit
MVNVLMPLEQAAEVVGHDEAVLIGFATLVGHRMVCADVDPNVAAGSADTASEPIRILLARLAAL